MRLWFFFCSVPFHRFGSAIFEPMLEFESKFTDFRRLVIHTNRRKIMLANSHSPSSPDCLHIGWMFFGFFCTSVGSSCRCVTLSFGWARNTLIQLEPQTFKSNARDPMRIEYFAWFYSILFFGLFVQCFHLLNENAIKCCSQSTSFSPFKCAAIPDCIDRTRSNLSKSNCPHSTYFCLFSDTSALNLTLKIRLRENERATWILPSG